MKKILLPVLMLVFLSNCTTNQSEWGSLIVDDSLEGWHIFQDEGSKKGWIVEDQVLIFNGVSDMETGEGDASIALGGEIEVNNAIEDLALRKHFVGALYDLSAPTETDVARPANEWNSYHIKIDYRANRGELILNGVLINSFPLEGPEWEAMVQQSKFGRTEGSEYLGDEGWKGFGKFSKGHICFQDHPGKVSFRNIQIKELD